MTTELQSGNLENYYGGPELTPYTRGILDLYPIQIPLFQSLPTNFTGLSNQRTTIVTDPHLHDTLYIAAHCRFTDGPEAERVFLQITNLQTGLFVSSIGAYPDSPITAYAGVNNNAMPNLLLPESLFITKGTRLRLDFSIHDTNLITGGIFTLIGFQLVGCVDENACISMPDGQSVRIGRRMPWMHTVGVGREQFIGNSQIFTIAGGEVWSAYMPPIDCDIDVTDMCMTFFGDVSDSPDLVLFRLTDSGDREMFTLNLAPSRAIFGDNSKAYPGLYLTKPYRVVKGRRLRIECISRNPLGQAVTINVVFRGVRLCEY